MKISSNIGNSSGKRLHKGLLSCSEKLLNYCAAPVILWQENGHLLFANKAAAHLFDYDVDEMSEKLSTTFFPSLFPPLSDFFHKASTTTILNSVEGKKNGGDTFLCTLKGQILEDEGKKLLSTTLTNITTEGDSSNLSKIEQGWRMALEGSNQGVWDWDMQTNEVYYSPSWNKMMGYKEEEVAHSLSEWKDRLHPDDKETVQEHVNKHKKSSSASYESVFRLRTKDGSYKWILSRGTIIAKSKNGTPLRMVGTHTDITERKKIEENYRFLFYNNPLPMWTFDRESLKILEVNDAAIEHYGYSRKEFMRMSIMSVHVKEDLKNVKELIQFNKDKEKVEYKRLRHQKKNGEIMYVNLSRHIFKLDQKEYGLVISSDVTGQVKAEEELLQSKEQYRLLFEGHPSPSWIIDNETLRFLEVNDAVVKHYGYSKEEFAHMSLFDITLPEDKEILVNTINTFSRQKGFYIPTGRHVKKSGEQIIVEIKGSMLEYNGKKARLSVLNDITAKLEAEANLKVSNERFYFASKATSDIIWEWDIKKNVVYWSENYEKILGWHLSADKLVPSDVTHYRTHPDDRARVEASLSAIMTSRDKNIWEDEFRYQKADGTYAFVSSRGFVLKNNKGEAVRVYGAMQDITKHKYQQQLQALELKVFEESAVPGIHFHRVLKALIGGFEEMHPGMYASVSIFNLNNGLEIVAPSLTLTERQRIQDFIEKKKDPLQKKEHGLIISGSGSRDWKGKGEAGWKTSWTVPVYRQSGNLLGFFIIFLQGFRDPTEAESNVLSRLSNLLRILIVNHLSVEQIHLSNERYNNVIRATNDMVWDWNLETGTFYRNPEGLRRVYGVQNKQSVEKVYNWLKRIHPDDHKKLQQKIDEVLQSSQQDSFDIEYRFKKDDGSYSFIYDRGIIVRNHEGKPLRLIGAAQNITDRKRLEQELLKKELDKQKIISQATIDTQEKERREIGKELHDNVNQVLTTTKLYLDLSINSPELKDELIQKSSKNIIYVINEIRQLSRSLMDPSIGDLGLIDSLKDLIESIQITGRLLIELKVDECIEDVLSENQKLMVFRIIQETLNNVLKHAQATSVQIDLENGGDAVKLVIKDNGKGFKPETIKKGSGLKNIQNRVYLANGKLIIDTAPGKGTKININFPNTIQNQTR